MCETDEGEKKKVRSQKIFWIVWVTFPQAKVEYKRESTIEYY